MESFYKDFFDYTYHYNNKIITSFIDDNEGKINDKLIVLLNHTINAHEIWNARIIGKACTTGVWEIRPIIDLEEQNRANYKCSLQIIETHDVNSIIQYTNSKSQNFENSVKDILFHIINHSTYHRGQIATYYKQEGGIPLISDYIMYKR
ncbi:damage-inducible protein DinB [Flavobacterium arcticum]|uniref:Damage-inducible protein DinB n=2 Tax=Flavobacterium arcticum TaxID=1784713 RepID=A0A345HDC4_9FLAO|nr:DinB family protein [Flavobacterium arcticum]AXG74584.1 damage-inducible protein DinB [Flavobacterium arcticum]KAF2512296.1 damage-inducible protein DinB [Flavobacterium arcticum]